MLKIKALIEQILNCCYTTVTSGDWTARKYADGTFDAYYIGSISIATTTASAAYGGYRTANPIGVAIPAAWQSWDWKFIQGGKPDVGSCWTNDWYRNGNNIVAYWHNGSNETQTRKFTIMAHGTWQ